MAKPSDHYGITRSYDKRSRTSGWSVGIGRNGEMVGRAYFGDKKYGSRENSLKAAQEHRDHVLMKFPASHRAVANQRLQSNNSTGQPGVYMTKKHGVATGYCAQTRLPSGRTLTRAFSFGRYGQEEALRLATQERLRQLQKILGTAAFAVEAVKAENSPVGTAHVRDLAANAPERAQKKTSTVDVPPELRAEIAELRRKGTSLKWIYRFRSSRGTLGWQVSIEIKKQIVARRAYMDTQHGGWEAGLDLAKKFRDAAILQFGLDP